MRERGRSILWVMAAVGAAASAEAVPRQELAEVHLLAIRSLEVPATDVDADPFGEWLELRRVGANVRALEAAGRRLAVPFGGFEPRFSWPLADLGSGQFDPWAISNFVDQDPTWPGQELDYACGARTYDTQDGYNHTGNDIFLYPFAWRLKDRGRVAVVAAAPGQIVERRDGEPDESCTLGGGASNTIVLEHSDGSRSFYRHLKNGSVTPKQVGDSVVRGEHLGLVASSGNSTGPHLHFAARNAAEELIEPFAGFCNAQANGMTSWWLDQPRYREYRLVDLTTHVGIPTDPPCPEPEDPRYRRHFAAGQRVVVGAYFRDPTPSSGATLRILRPNGSIYAQWSFEHAEARNATAVYWGVDLPDIILGDLRGRWRVRATYVEPDGATVARERAFWVGALFADDFELEASPDPGWQTVGYAPAAAASAN